MKNLKLYNSSEKMQRGMFSYKELVHVIESMPTTYYLGYLQVTLQNSSISETPFCYILRKIRPFLYSASDPDNLLENKMSNAFHRSYCSMKSNTALGSLKILTLLLKNSCLSNEIIMKYFNDRDLVLICDVIANGNEEVKYSARDLLEIILEKHTAMQKVVLEVFFNYCVELKEKIRIFNIELLIEVAIKILKLKTEVCELCDYEQFIIPVVDQLIYADLNQTLILIKIYCENDARCQKKTTTKVRRYLKDLKTSNMSNFFEIMRIVVETYNLGFNNENICDDVIEVFKDGFSSDSFLISEAAISAFETNAIKKYFESKTNEILPKIFNIVYKASKSFWRRESRCKFLKLMEYFMNADLNMFEKCLLSYNKEKIKILKIERNEKCFGS